jgi:ribosomal protein L7/L12
MLSDDTNFEDELRTLLAAGRKIEAIKVYRENTGVGLKQAKDTVEALEQGKPLPSKEPVDSSFEGQIISLLGQNQKIAAIKLYREKTGVGLKEAKDAVEALEQGKPLPSREPVDSSFEGQIISLLEQGQKIGAIKLYREKTGVGLKEAKDFIDALAADRRISVPKGSGCLGILLLLILIPLAAIVLGCAVTYGG